MVKLGRGKEPAISAADRGEMATIMEPLVLSEGSRHRAALADLAIDLAAKSASFRRSLPASLLTSPATLIRSVNCHYSNLIEGHDTHPVDIERALCEDYSLDARKRDLQMEARAHIAVQRWIDEGGSKGNRSQWTGSWRSTAAFANSCRRIFCWWKIQLRRSVSRRFPGNCATGT